VSDDRVLLLDLDQTLYPKSTGLWSAISERINLFIVDRLGMAETRAAELRSAYLKEYGTTLHGLVDNHHVEAQDYLAFVHDLPLEQFLLPDPSLGKMLASLRPRRVVFTNASTQHAQRVLRALAIEDQVDQIIDILTLEMVNKPRPEAYHRALRLTGEPDPSACTLVDDLPVNLEPAYRLGMTTVLVGSEPDPTHVDFTIPSIHRLVDVLPQLA
jgi:pyrimidine 5'-nucleotidase